MALALEKTELYERLSSPGNLAYTYIKDERLLEDVWNIEQDLPPLIEDSRIRSVNNVSFKGISLPWLKELAKLATLVAVSSRKWGLSVLLGVLSATRKFDAWLVKQGYITPSVLTLQVVQQYRQNTSHTPSLQLLLNLLHKLDCIQFRVVWPSSYKTKRVTTIPEKVKQKLDLALLDLDKPIYLVFKLHAALGTRSSEIPKIPLDCLRWREGVPRIRLCTGKLDDIQQEQDLPEELLVLVQEQQDFVRQRFGEDFEWLFPHWAWSVKGFAAKKKWPPTFKYFPEQGRKVNIKLNHLLRSLIKENDIRTENGELAYVTTHMFRRTFGTVADRMGKRPDQIQHALRHANPDMQDHYVAVSPQAQEKRIERVLVNKDGKPTIYRTDRDTEFLRREWTAREVELGVCVRPSIMQDCEFEHICLQCEHVRYAPEHLPQLLKVREGYQQLLERSMELGQSDSRRANSAQQFIGKLDPIITNLENSASLKVGNE